MRKTSSKIVTQAVPARLGQYELLERIGQGAMGSVYKAWHVKLKRQVAVKVLSPKNLNDSEAVGRFSRELEAIGRLDDHPNIVRARDAAEIDGFHFLVMDYVDGIDAGRLVCQVGPLTVPDACLDRTWHRMTRTWRQRPRWLVVLPLIAILLLFGVLLARRRRKAAPDMQLLLCAEPRQLLWDYDTTRKELQVRCSYFAFFKCAELNQGDYTISTNLMPPEEQKGAGIFLGYGDRNYDAKAMKRSLELVGLRHLSDGQTPDQYEVFRRTLHIRGDPAIQSQWILSKGRAAPVVYDPSGTNSLLTAIVANGQLVRVLWNGKELKPLTGDVPSDGQAKVVAMGACGVFNQGGTAKFHDTRVTRRARIYWPSRQSGAVQSVTTSIAGGMRRAPKRGY